MTVETSKLYAFRCQTCWQTNVAPQEIAGTETTCDVCGAEFEAPEVTEARIAVVEELENADTPIESVVGRSSATARDHFAAINAQPTAYPMQLEGFHLTNGELDFSGHWLASRTSRLIASFIDGVALTIAAVFGLLAFYGLANYGLVEVPRASNEIPVMMISVISFFPLVLLIVQWNMTATSGRTLGKLLMGIRIVSMNGKLPGFFFGVFMRSWVMTFVYYIPFMQLLDILFIFGGGRRCIHDLIAGTRVVEG